MAAPLKRTKKSNPLQRVTLALIIGAMLWAASLILQATNIKKGESCQRLANRCAMHQHENESLSLNKHDRLKSCPCEEFVGQRCLREPASVNEASRVEQVCASVDLTPMRLTLGNGKANAEKIKKLTAGSNKFINHVVQYYRRNTTTQGTTPGKAANQANSEYLKESPLKTVALKFSEGDSRRSNPKAYLIEFLHAAHSLSPKLSKSIDDYLTYHHKLVKGSVIRVAEKGELKENGGKYHSKDSGDGKTALREITLSTESSDSVPNQFSTLFHELIHAENFEPLLLLDAESAAYAEAALLDEAKAYDAQMVFYLELVKENPELFCNWLSVSQRYGSLVVPLGWLMASVEMELRNGSFMAAEAAKIKFKDKGFLFAEDGRVRPDLRARMQSLGFEFAH